MYRNVAAEHRVQIVFDDLRSEVCIGTLLFLFNIKIRLGNLWFWFLEAYLCLLCQNSLLDCRYQVLRCFYGGRPLVFKTFENGTFSTGKGTCSNNRSRLSYWFRWSWPSFVYSRLILVSPREWSQKYLSSARGDVCWYCEFSGRFATFRRRSI